MNPPVIALLSLLLGFLSALDAALVCAGDSRPNIVFFLADDQRHDTLGCAGHPIIRSPNIDALAARGIRFRNAFVSHSICWVSRTTILTGLNARSFGRPDMPDAAKLDALTAMYPDLLREAGYRTGFFGKWHAKMPEGFDPAEHFDQFENITRTPYFKQQPDGSLRHETQLIGDRAVEFLNHHTPDQPFCLHLWFNAAHAEDRDRDPGYGHFPWPRVMDGWYDDVPMPPPRLNDPAIFDSQPAHLKRSLNRVRYFWRWDTPEKYETNMRGYFRMISGIDHVVGRVVEALCSRGFDQNTIVVYSADNGYYLGDRGFAGKWSHYEQSLRVPLVIVDPRLPETNRGKEVDQLVLNLDLPSTFLDWAGLAVPVLHQGRSLKEISDGGTPSRWRNDFFCEHVTLAPQLTWEGVHGQRYVYARYFDQAPPYEFLHDLEADPDQILNLADYPEYATELAAMRRRCDELVAEYGGPLQPLAPDGPRKR